jgi:hypothetical protein
MPTPILSALDVLSLADLRDLVVELSVRVAGLEEENARRREENARLKGLPKKPPLVPGGMDKATSAAPSTPDEAGRRKRRQRRSRTALAVHEAPPIDGHAATGLPAQGLSNLHCPGLGAVPACRAVPA